MTVRELNIGDVFRVVGEEQLYRKWSSDRCRRAGTMHFDHALSHFRDKAIEIVERAGEICRAEDTLILRGGEVTLEYRDALQVHRCTPGEPFTEIVFSGVSYWASRANRPTEQTALLFSVRSGAKHLNRPSGSEILAYNGRLYARATNKEVLGKRKVGGYKIVRNIDGAKRLVIAGLLTLPSEFALYDIIMEHFGPDTVPR